MLLGGEIERVGNGECTKDPTAFVQIDDVTKYSVLSSGYNLLT